MAYKQLPEAAQARIRATLEVTGSAKLQRSLEADHYARTLLGQEVESVDARLAKMRRPTKPDKPSKP